MAEASAAGTSSTPTADPAAAPALVTIADPAIADPAPAIIADPAADPARVADPVADAPLFVLPDDFKPPESAVAKFTASIKAAMADGKLNVTAQQVVDMYVEQARDANAAWQKQVQSVDKANETTCKARFSTEQLAASETAVGWFSSFEPAFRELAKRQLNDPVFVNAMRIVGELLGEDEFEPAPRGAPSKRSPAEIMGYTKPS